MRLSVLSNEQLDPWVNWSTLGPPLLQPLARFAQGTVLAPPPLRLGHAERWWRALRGASGADTYFWMQGSSRPEWPLVLLSAFGGRVRRSAYVIDAWKPQLNKIGLAAIVQHLDPCFVAFKEGRDELARRFPKGRFEWLPFGSDTDVFAPSPGPRDIFAYWMGRRYEPLHRALVTYCEARGLVYRFTRRPGEFPDARDLGRLVGRCQYFVVTPPDLDDPVRTGGFSPLVMRYLEGLSAGARLLGVLPASGEYDALLPRDAILEVAPDGSDLADRLDADIASGGGRDAVEKARVLVGKHHSWTRRAEQIHARLALGQPITFDVSSPDSTLVETDLRRVFPA